MESTSQRRQTLTGSSIGHEPGKRETLSLGHSGMGGFPFFLDFFSLIIGFGCQEGASAPSAF